MLATLQSDKMVPVIYKGNNNLLKVQMINSMPALKEGNLAVPKKNRDRTAFTSVGFAIPFQPSMWDEKYMQAAWNHALKMVELKLKDRCGKQCSSSTLTRLEEIFPKLNYNTHRKSIAIILTPGDEKIVYLSFPVKPVVCVGQSVSVLDLAANMQQEPGFYYCMLNEKSAALYECDNKQWHKVYEQNYETCGERLLKNTANTIELLNSECNKPVFVSGMPNMAHRFCKSVVHSKVIFTFLYHATHFSDEVMKSHVNEITGHWSYWQSKFTQAKILLAQKEGTLISHIDAVLQALSKCSDGLLLVDKNLQHQLKKSCRHGKILHLADAMLIQLEKFLIRGNRIEFKKAGLLKDMGGIVLLQGNNYGYSPGRPAFRSAGFAGSLY